IVEGLNTFAIEGGASTLTLAEAVPPVPPSVALTFPVVLFCKPAAVPVTLTVNVQELLAGIVPPDRLITLVFCVSGSVPLPHEPGSPFGVGVVRPARHVWLNRTPLRRVVVV